jgi:2-amino-4-hydroxy-6-hydroxymethyldihydropteridine diphosphokinase
MSFVAIALGANMGDRLYNINLAMYYLKKYLFINEIMLSSIYESRALLIPGSPAEWNLNYYNMVIAGECNANPYRVLELLKTVEQELGRFESSKYAPRPIDLDLLFYDNLIIDEQNLCIPHKEMLKRDFVMIPLSEIMPNLNLKFYTENDLTIKELLKCTTVKSVIKQIEIKI